MKKNKVLVFIIGFVLMGFLLYTLEWPVDNKNFKRLFGEKLTPDHTIFEYGFTFENIEVVRAADYGKRLITIENKNSMRGFPSTLGNAIILIHSDNIQTVYGNLESTRVFEKRDHTDGGAIIGRVANTAWGEPKNLIFQVLDVKNKVYINPGLLLTSVIDKFAPKIKGVILVDEANRRFDLKLTDKLNRGKYSLYVKTVDAITAADQKFNPMHFSVVLNGISVANLSFQTICVKKGTGYIKDDITSENLYNTETGLFLGNITLTSGSADLQITSKDIHGNESEKTYRFQVN